MSNAPNWPAIDFYLAALDDRLEQATRDDDPRLLAEVVDEMRLARRDLREMEAAGITRP